jgi:hypothetical protein
MLGWMVGSVLSVSGLWTVGYFNCMEELTRESKLLSETQQEGGQEMRELQQVRQGMEWPQQ